MVVLYPQAVRSGIFYPNGCWDWWGYTGDAYYSRDGAQMKAIFAMLKHLAGKDQLTKALANYSADVVVAIH